MHRILFPSCALFVLVLSASGQSTPQCSPGGPGFATIGTGGQPFTATIKVSSEQTLSDSSHVRGYFVVRRAQNTAGDTYEEYGENCYRAADGQTLAVKGISVHLYDRRLFEHWQVGPGVRREVTSTHFGPRSQTKLSDEDRQRVNERRALKPKLHEPTIADLGTKTILGLAAHGKRVTRVIPPGVAGNEGPLTTVEETWSFEKPRMTLLRTFDDPRVGRQTVEVTELKLGEPDPALFVAPAGYTIIVRTADSDVSQAATAATAEK